jgi:hypothetical protein
MALILHLMIFRFLVYGLQRCTLCLPEPWCGIADSVDHNQQLADKEGIMLEPGKVL